MRKPDLKLVEDTGSQLEVDVFDPPPQQAEMPFAMVDGEPFTQLPKDLYIPPDALQVFLEAFEGPLDLLLYLIRRQNLDVLDIPIAEITRQYMHYIEVMQELQLELAGEYLLMAAMLAEIKSRMLLPQLGSAGDEEEDPRAELVRRLQEYERFKKAAEDLDRLPRMERDTMAANVEIIERKVVRAQPEVSLREMLLAFKDVLSRADMFAHHHISREQLSVRQRMSDILDRLRESAFIEFVRLFDPAEGRMGVTVTFIAVLELMKEGLLEIVQAEPYAPIHIRPASGRRHLMLVGEVDANVDVDAENVAALAQPAHPDENDDPDDDAAPSAGVAVDAAGAEVPAGEQASLQVGEPAAQVEMQAVEAAAVSSDAAVAQAETTTAAEHAAGVSESSQQPVLLDAAAIAAVAAAVQEGTSATVEPDGAVASAGLPSSVEPAQAEIVSQSDASAPTVAGVAAEVVRVEVDADGLTPERMLALAREGDAELAADQSATSPAASLAASDLDGSAGFEVQPLVVLEDAESATAPAFEHIGGPVPGYVDAGFIHGFEGPVLQTASHPADLSHELVASTLLLEPSSFAQIPSDTTSEAPRAELTESVGAMFEAEPAVLNQLVAGRIETQTSEGHEAAMGTSPVEPVAEASASMAAEQDAPASVFEQVESQVDTELAVAPLDLALEEVAAPEGEVSVSVEFVLDDVATDTPAAVAMAVGEESEQIVGNLLADQAVAPQPSDPGFESELPALTAFETLEAEVSSATAPLDPDAEPAVAMSDLVLDEAAVAAQAVTADIEFPPSLEVAARELSDDFEAVEAGASPTHSLLDADAGPAVATLDPAPDEAVGAPQVAASDVEASGSLQSVASELLDDAVTDTSASTAVRQESEEVVGSIADQTTAPQLSEQGFESELPAMTVFEAVEGEASSGTALLDASPGETADTLEAGVFDLEAAGGFDVAASESLDGGVDTLASMNAGDESEPFVGRWLADQPITPLLSDAGLEPELPSVAAESSLALTVLEEHVEPAVAALDLVPDEAAEALESAASDVEAAVSLEFVASELLDDAGTDASASMTVRQEPEQVVGSIADQTVAAQLSEQGSESELPAMTAFEAVEAESFQTTTLLDVVPAEAADVRAEATFDVEVAAGLEVAVSESLDGIADVPITVGAGQEPDVTVGAMPADQPIAPQLSDAGLEPELPAVAASCLAPSLLEADAERTVAMLDFAPDEAVDALPAEASEVEASVSLEFVASELLDDPASDAPVSMHVGQASEQVGGSVIAPQLGDLDAEPELSAMTAFEAVEAEVGPPIARLEADLEAAVPILDLVPDEAALALQAVASDIESPAEVSQVVALSEASIEAAVTGALDLDVMVATEAASSVHAAMLDFEPAMPTETPEASSAATLDAAVSTAREEWFDDFIIDVPALGTVQHQLEQGATASISARTDGAQLQATGLDTDVLATTAFEAGAAAGPASVPTEAGTVSDAVAELEVEPAAPAEAIEAPQAATFESPVLANQEVQDSAWFDDFVIDVPALGVLQHQLGQTGALPDEGAALEVEPAAAEPEQAGEAAIRVSESGVAAAASILELGPAASMTVDAPQVPALEEQGSVGEHALPLEVFEAHDVDAPVATSSLTQIEREGFDGGATGAAAGLVAEDVVAGASAPVPSAAATDVSLPELQSPSTAPPVQPRDVAPQVAVALSATRDAAPPSEQLRRGSVTALLDEYPTGAMQWESRETNSVESVYEVDVAAFSSPLAFEHYPLKDGSD